MLAIRLTAEVAAIVPAGAGLTSWHLCLAGQERVHMDAHYLPSAAACEAASNKLLARPSLGGVSAAPQALGAGLLRRHQAGWRRVGLARKMSGSRNWVSGVGHGHLLGSRECRQGADDGQRAPGG